MIKANDNEAAILIERQALENVDMFMNLGNTDSETGEAKASVKGAWSRGFCRFLVKTVLKLSVANFIHAQQCV